MKMIDRWLEDGPKIEVSQCIDCKWKSTTGVGCKAFIEGIPIKILSNEIIHDKPLQDQGNDYVYEKNS